MTCFLGRVVIGLNWHCFSAAYTWDQPPIQGSRNDRGKSPFFVKKMNGRSRVILALAALCMLSLVTLPFVLKRSESKAPSLPGDLKSINKGSSNQILESLSDPQKPSISVLEQAGVMGFGAKLRSLALSRRFVAGLMALVVVVAVVTSLYFVITATSQTQDIIIDLEEDPIDDPINEPKDEDDHVELQEGGISLMFIAKIVFGVIAVLVALVVMYKVFFEGPAANNSNNGQVNGSTGLNGGTLTANNAGPNNSSSSLVDDSAEQDEENFDAESVEDQNSEEEQHVDNNNNQANANTGQAAVILDADKVVNEGSEAEGDGDNGGRNDDDNSDDDYQSFGEE